MPRTVRAGDSVGLLALVVTLGIVAWARRANAKGKP